MKGTLWSLVVSTIISTKHVNGRRCLLDFLLLLFDLFLSSVAAAAYFRC